MLCVRGPLTIREIVTFVKLSVEVHHFRLNTFLQFLQHTKKSLCVLLQHQMLTFSETEVHGQIQTKYRLLSNMVLMRLRFPQLSNSISQKYGKNVFIEFQFVLVIEKAEALLDTLLETGIMPLRHLLQKVKETSTLL